MKPNLKTIKTKDAVGTTICHDITVIIKDTKKDVAFKKGHIVTESDIPTLLSLGKDNLYVYNIDNNDAFLHENDAAKILADICINTNMSKSEVKEGKIDLYSTIDGLFKVDIDRLFEINELDDIIISTRHNNFPVKANDKLLGTRAIPLMAKKDSLEKAKAIYNNEPICKVLPYDIKSYGIVTTGNEVFHKRIEDTFTPVIKAKLSQFNLETNQHIIVDDNTENIKKAILQLKQNGCELIICTGGMSVDPDDLTPSAISQVTERVVTYGTPVLPGAMFTLGYFDDETPVVGLPGCVMYSKATIFDLVLPRLLARDTISSYEFSSMGHGGLCLECPTCHFPNCSFGKGL